jgi:hypothetical protein
MAHDAFAVQDGAQFGGLVVFQDGAEGQAERDGVLFCLHNALAQAVHDLFCFFLHIPEIVLLYLYNLLTPNFPICNSVGCRGCEGRSSWKLIRRRGFAMGRAVRLGR